MDEMTKLRWQRALAALGVLYVILVVIFWYLLGHFYDPASAALGPDELARYYETYRDSIRLGSAITCYIAVLHVGWVALLTLKMAKIEGSMPIFAIIQLIGGILTIYVISLSLILWTVSAFRVESDPRIIQVLNDTAWLTLDMPWPLTTAQMIAVAIVGLYDKRPERLFPKWVCWLSIEGGLGFALLSFLPWAKTGVWSWNGLLGFWVPFVPWFIWLFAISYYMIKDITRDMRSLAA